ncbi:hypothetical protein EMIT048CA2_140067 [Pseudomonas chlororaphis]|uniref:hypothetical protein n=1 Tax=Pseudomonas chlororaphis TaxID=587753 RepID=UPI0039E0A5C6
MAWYRAGTVAVSNGSTTVTGTGTGFSANARVGDAFIGPDGRQYELANVASDTVISIGSPYLGTTATGQPYVVMPVQGYQKLLADTVRDWVNAYGPKMAALGTASDKNTGTSGTTVPLLSGANTWGAQQTFAQSPIANQMYIAAGAYGGYQITNNAGVQLSAFSMDWANSSTFLDVFFKFFIRDSSAGYPIRLAITSTGTVQHPGYTQLGEAGPAIKTKLLTGTCSGVAGGLAQAAHGISSAKIIGIQALVQTTDANTWISPGGDYPGYTFSAYFGLNNVNILNGATNSSGAFGKPFKVLVTYQE